MQRTLVSIAGLAVLLFLLDLLFRVLHPEVDLARACLVGATALAALAPLWLLRWRPIAPLVGALSIFASAFLSVLLIEAGVLVSKSAGSALVHVLILAMAFVALERASARADTGARTL